MLDLLWRAARHPIDYAGALRRRTLMFKDRRDEGGGVTSFFFEPTRPLAWQPGQHGVLTMPDRYIAGQDWRAFSIASSCHESVVQISTIIPPEPSDFKRQLCALAPGDQAILHGPYGELHPRPHRHQLVGIAGGIGITPFRAIMYEIANGYLPDVRLKLIYGGKNDYWTFAGQCQAWTEHARIDIAFKQDPADVNEAIDAAVHEFGNDADYFISGSPGMITAVTKHLRAQRVDRIFSDPFKGY